MNYEPQQKRIDESSPVPRYIQLKGILLELIHSGEIPVGEKIYSLHQLCTLFGVSDTTGKKAISDLVNEGFLKGKWGKGVYVVSRFPQKSHEHITFLVPTGPENLWHPAFSKLVSGVCNQLSQECYNLTYTFIDPAQMDGDEVARRIAQIESSGIIIPSIPSLEEEHLAILVEKEVPIVFISENHPRISPYSVTTDRQRFLGRVLENILGSGEKKIAIMGCGLKQRFDRTRQTVAQIAQNRGFDLDERLMKLGSYGFETGRKLMRDILNQHLKPELIIAEDDYVGYGALEVITEMGIEVPGEIQILGIGGFLSDYPFSSTLSTISLPFYSIGEAAGTMITTMTKGKKPVEQETIIPCVFEPGDTLYFDGEFIETDK